MFLKKFPDNALIKKIKISGPFISIYVPEAELENFQNKYPKLFSQYAVLSVGEGQMHDFAHYTHNKHLSFLHKNFENEHFHFILPTNVNEANLVPFLNLFEEQDLREEQKQQLISEFHDYIQVVQLESLSEHMKTYGYVLSAWLYKDPYFAQIMPLFNEMVIKLEPFLNEDGTEIDPLIKIKVGNHLTSADAAFNNITALLTHCGLFNSIREIIDQLDKIQTKNNSSGIIKNLNDLFKTASTTSFPNFGNVPYVFNELITHLPFINNLNNLYTTLKHLLAVKLKTDELVFIPQEINLPAKEINYNEAILFLGLQGNMGINIMNAMARLKEGNYSKNPYWINSGKKLQGIVDAVLNLKLRAVSVETALENPDSELYQALNKPRMLPVTLLGRFALNKSKSIMDVETELLNPRALK